MSGRAPVAAQLVGEALGRQLAARSSAPLFGLAGSGNLELIAAFQAAGGAYVAACHEAGAVTMADGWAQARRDVGLATLHQGPGLTNAMTALVDAAKARTPLLVIAADAQPGAGHANQWIAQRDALVALDAGLRVRRLSSADVAGQLAQAMRDARVERSPVILLAGIDVQLCWAESGSEEDPASVDDAPAPARASDEQVAALADRLRAARRPVILAGRGAVLADAGPVLRELGDRMGALLLTTAPAHGLFAGDPFCAGIAGGFASPLATRLAAEADLVLAVGSRLDPWTTCGGALFAGAHVTHVDVDLGTPAPVAAGDARAVAEQLLTRLGDLPADAAGYRTAELRAEIAQYRRAASLPVEDSGPLHPGHLCVALGDRLADRWCVVLDSGHFSAWPAMLADIREPGGLLFGQAFQAVGLGLARAIGAAIARPERIAVAMIGDGGAMMSLLELDTAVRLRLPLLVVIFNDAAYGAEVHDFRPLGVAVGAAQFPDRDLAAVARALGAEGATVRSTGDLHVLDTWLADPAGPLVIDAKVDPTVDAVHLLTPLGAADWSPAPRPNQGTP